MAETETETEYEEKKSIFIKRPRLPVFFYCIFTYFQHNFKYLLN